MTLRVSWPEMIDTLLLLNNNLVVKWNKIRLPNRRLVVHKGSPSDSSMKPGRDNKVSLWTESAVTECPGLWSCWAFSCPVWPLYQVEVPEHCGTQSPAQPSTECRSHEAHCETGSRHTHSVHLTSLCLSLVRIWQCKFEAKHPNE